jgi:hypothetical protein
MMFERLARLAKRIWDHLARAANPVFRCVTQPALADHSPIHWPASQWRQIVG